MKCFVLIKYFLNVELICLLNTSGGWHVKCSANSLAKIAIYLWISFHPSYPSTFRNQSACIFFSFCFLLASVSIKEWNWAEIIHRKRLMDTKSLLLLPSPADCQNEGLPKPELCSQLTF